MWARPALSTQSLLARTRKLDNCLCNSSSQAFGSGNPSSGKPDRLIHTNQDLQFLHITSMDSKVVLALDWTPNCNHTGFYVAKAKGWYAEAGLPDVELRSPHVDQYKSTPMSLVADRTATFAITPSESVISYHTWPDGTKPKVQAVAACLQDSTSAIVTLKSSGITRPAQLDGKVYASYGARFEGRSVQQMIRNDGGKGDFKEVCPPMLEIWDMLLKGQADATWIFLGWEGVEAEMAGTELNVFRLEDYLVPYGYSPLVVAHPDTIKESPQVVKAFVQASARGFEWAAAHPDEAAQLLLQEVEKDTVNNPLPHALKIDMLKKAQAFTSQHYLNSEGKWGHMRCEVWDNFLHWLSSSGLLTSKVQSRGAAGEHTTSLDGLRQGDVGELLDRKAITSSSLFTNEFLATA